jgi:3-methyladenine DNA glycosylase/8-oxoguanine DNA glycosylase
VFEIAVAPRGPYSLALSARIAGDATRRLRDGVMTALLEVDGRPETAHAWQSPDGTVSLRAASEAGAERLRWMLALDDDHSEFLRRIAHDPLLGRAASELRGLRQVRTATVAQSLLRAVTGQLVDWKTARTVERAVIRAVSPPGPEGLRTAPTTAALAAAAPFELCRLGLHERRAAALVRVCRTLDLERLHGLPTDAVVRRLERERGLGPWSAGVVCLQGLGRYERGLARDLGLVKLAAALWGRPVEAEETDALLAPYGEWAGLASVYLLAGYHAGLVGLRDENRDSRSRQDRRVAARRAA